MLSRSVGIALRHSGAFIYWPVQRLSSNHCHQDGSQHLFHSTRRSVSFALETGSHRLDPSRKTSVVSWVSRLQKIRAAFESIQVGLPEPLIPLNDLDSVQHEMAKDQITALSWQKRKLQIRGPLRSIPMLRGWDMPGWWRQVSLELRDGDHAAPGKSRYMLTMTGEMYERQD